MFRTASFARVSRGGPICGANLFGFCALTVVFRCVIAVKFLNGAVQNSANLLSFPYRFATCHEIGCHAHGFAWVWGTCRMPTPSRGHGTQYKATRDNDYSVHLYNSRASVLATSAHVRPQRAAEDSKAGRGRQEKAEMVLAAVVIVS